jgi:putative tricarboxylic transport membrane protein
VIASLASYAVEKKYSKHPEEFGLGAIEGVAGPESANNAASSSSFIPLLTLGIPGNAAIAMIFAALMIQGITPGPFLVKEHPDVFWGVIASMYIGNVMLLVLNLPLVGLWVQMLRVPYGILAPIIVLFTTIGVYSTQNQVFDIYSMLFFAVLGYLMRKLNFDTVALPLAFVLGPLVERSLRQSLLLSGGDLMIFVSRPISGTLTAVVVLLIVGQTGFNIRKKMRKAPSVSVG